MKFTKHRKNSCRTCLLLVGHLAILSQAWMQPHPARRTTVAFLSSNDSNNNNPFSFLTNPYESKIPQELRDEIYAAEANTPAAKERGARVALYGTIAFVGILGAFFNGFITELRNAPLPPGIETGDPLTVAGFDWVRSNPITGFFFTNKIGGGICLLGGAGAGLLAEAELDTKRINAEKIFEELERRRDQKRKKTLKTVDKKGKKRSGKEKKRSKALSEVLIAEVEEETTVSMAAEASADEVVEKAPINAQASEKQDDGILGQLKGFYEKADSMAASQALLLNKELEDRGLVEKITDETGLKVIGREKAAKLQEQKTNGEGVQ